MKGILSLTFRGGGPRGTLTTVYSRGRIVRITSGAINDGRNAVAAANKQTPPPPPPPTPTPRNNANAAFIKQEQKEEEEEEEEEKGSLILTKSPLQRERETGTIGAILCFLAWETRCAVNGFIRVILMLELKLD